MELFNFLNLMVEKQGHARKADGRVHITHGARTRHAFAARHREPPPRPQVMDNWPTPPFFREAVARAETDPVEAIIFKRDGSTSSGRLLTFSPAGLSVQFVTHDSQDGAALRFHDIKSIHLIHPVELAVDHSLVQLFRQTGGHAIGPGERFLEVHFVDGEQLHGQTRGFVKTRCGLLIYLTTEGSQVVRIFVPEDAMTSYQVGKLLGQQLIDDALVEPDMVQQALLEQNRRKQKQLDPHLGDLHGAQAAQSDTQCVGPVFRQPRHLHASTSGRHPDRAGTGFAQPNDNRTWSHETRAA